MDLRDRLDTLGFERLNVLGRGVDGRLFSPERRCAELRRHWGASESDAVALYVGRIAPEKNLGLAIDAYRAMRRINPAAKFVIVGEGPLFAALRQAHPDLIFSGLRTGEQLARHYASADLFLFPSETETFGNVTLEAMASGLVVIAYNYAAAKMHIVNGETGVLIPYGDSGSFVEAALQFARSPRSFDTMRTPAREYAASVGWARVVSRLETLLAGPRGQSHDAPSHASTRGFGSIAATGRV